MKKYIPKLIGAGLNALSYLWPTKAGDMALQIFGKPRKGKLRERDIAYLNNFTKKTLIKNGLKFPLYTKGNGKSKILLLHGWESNAARWRKLNDVLENELDCTLYMIDAPAHGGSEGDDFSSIGYAHFINETCKNIKPDIIIGHSIGAGSITYCHSQLQKLEADKIVLIGSPDTFTEIMETYIEIINFSKKGRTALEKAIVRKYNLLHTDYAVSKYVKTLNTTTLVLHDEHDNVSVVQNAINIANNLPNGQLHITNGYGHGMQHPNVFAAIVGFVKG